MKANNVLVRTAKGVEEVETRKHKLEPKLRVLLITVNGKATAAELAAKFAQIGDVSAQLASLIEQGYVSEAQAPKDAAKQLEHARQQLGAFIAAALGPNGDPIAARIEACASTDELRAYVEGKRSALQAALGQKAAEFFSRAKSLLA
jgi:hypothetical protein